MMEQLSTYDLLRPDAVPIKISVKSCKQLFQGCSEEYIKTICHGRCCHSTQLSGTTYIATVLPNEEDFFRGLGIQIGDGFILPRPGEARCPFQLETGLCVLHERKQKPFSCIMTPFTLNDKNTLIIRNRMRRLRCYRDREVASTETYKAYFASLVLMFGQEEAIRIKSYLDLNSEDFTAWMPKELYKKVITVRNKYRWVMYEAAKSKREKPCLFPPEYYTIHQ